MAIFDLQGIGDLITGVIIIAIIYVLVRPGTPAPKVIADLTKALTNMLTAAEGNGQTNG